ncbi:MAG: hypothetical protein WC473_01470 [Patescibacteria group bacterium]
MANNGILVLVESPFAGEIAKNVRYARACIHDCLIRGEYPFASHLFYTQTGILRDEIPGERKLGIDAGLAWGKKADKTVVYMDLGLSQGMQYGIKAAKEADRPIEFRYLPDWEELVKSDQPLGF